MSELPPQRFKGLVHLPPLEENGPARMGFVGSDIEEEIAPEGDAPKPWKSRAVREGGKVVKKSGREVDYRRHFVGSNFADVLKSDMVNKLQFDTHDGKKVVAFNVDDYIEHFGEHPEKLIARRALSVQRVRAHRSRKSAGEQIDTTTQPTKQPIEQPRPARPASSPAGVQPPVSGFTCVTCGERSPHHRKTPEGMAFMAKHMHNDD